MEQMFQRNFFAFFLEFKQFGFHFSKATTSFLKLNFELLCLLVFLLRCLGHLLFEGPSLNKRHSPTRSTPVEKNAPVCFPPRFF